MATHSIMAPYDDRSSMTFFNEHTDVYSCLSVLLDGIANIYFNAEKLHFRQIDISL